MVELVKYFHCNGTLCAVGIIIDFAEHGSYRATVLSVTVDDPKEPERGIRDQFIVSHHVMLSRWSEIVRYN